MPILYILTEKVDRLLTLLTSYKLPNDDTLLEKLLNWIDGVVHRDAVVKNQTLAEDPAWQFLEASSIIQFLKRCSRNNDSNADLLTFALKLCGCVGDVYFEELETEHTVSALFENALGPDHWDHPSVRCAYIQMLHSICQNKAGRCWFSQKGCTTQMKACLFDTSIFVVSAAIKLMSSRIIDLTKDAPSNMDQNTSTPTETNGKMDIDNGMVRSEDLLDFIMQPLRTDSSLAQGDVSVGQTTVPLQRSLAVLQVVCKDRRLAQMMVSQHDLVECLCNVLSLRTDCAKSYEALLDLISILVKTGRCGDCLKPSYGAVSEVHYSRLKKTAFHLAETGHFLSSLQLTRSLLQSSESDTPDPAFTELLLSPLMVTVGLDPQHLGDALWEQLKRTLADKRVHVQLLRETLAALRDVKVQQDWLPLVATLLSCTQKEADLGSSPLVTNMIGCSKIQQMALDVLCQRLKDENLVATREVTLQIFHCCVTFLHSSLSSAAICGKTFHCMCLVLKHLSSLGLLNTSVDVSKEEAGGVLDVLQSTLQRSLCDVKWETRDSAVEFVSLLTSNMKENAAVVSWVIEGGAVDGVWQCVSDGESYVRAAALTALGCLSEVTQVWRHLTTTLGQRDIVEKITDVIRNDTEAFARRAAVDLLTKLWTNNLVDLERSCDIEKVMRDAIGDFDWEVKMRVLNFWDKVPLRLEIQSRKRYVRLEMQSRKHDSARLETCSLKCDSPEQSIDGVLQEICDRGGLVVLMEAFNDYDKPVQKKACMVLKNLKVEYVDETIHTDSGCSDDNDAACREMGSTSECRAVEMSSQDVDTTTNDDTRVRKVADGRDVSEFVRWLRAVDLDSVCVTIDQSTDRYADNPESLVDDLLTSLERIEHMTDTEGEESGEENVIDCY